MEESEKANFEILNGKIACECEIDTEIINSLYHSDSNYSCYDYITFQTNTMDSDTLEKRSCLEDEQLEEYLGSLELDKVGYALHLSNIKVFDKPKELNNLNNLKGYSVHNAPQNMCWVYDLKNDTKGRTIIEKKLLISIRPQWVRKILNGEKDIEVRRKVLKGMCD
jgi:predicted transcriptional regulator